MSSELSIAYFGGEPIGVPVANELFACGLTPQLVVCNPDRPSGRGNTLHAPPMKTWAEAHNVPVWQPENLKDEAAVTEQLRNYDLFVVVAYNRILPSWLIELPKHKTLNVHPSLLPALRGPSPIRTAIVEDRREEIGVSIMRMDEEMDHGPLLTKQPLPIANEYWPIDGAELDQALAHLGGALLASVIPDWVAGTITPTEQDHKEATYTKKHTRSDGELLIDPLQLPTGEAARAALHKIRGFALWPGTYFFHNQKRIKIKNAQLSETGQLDILEVIPEGKSAMSFSDWKHHLHR